MRSRLSSFVVILRRGGLMFVLILYVPLLWLAWSRAVDPALTAQACVDDAYRAAQVAAAGQLEYTGPCVSFGSSQPLTEHEMTSLVADAEEFLDTSLQIFSSDQITGRVVAHVAGYPTVILAEMLGMVVIGWSLGSGAAALITANAETRRSYLARELVGGAAVMILLYLASVVLVTWGMRVLIAAQGWEIPAGEAPTWFQTLLSVASPLVGLLVYFAVGVLIGVVTKRGVTGIALGAALLLAEALFPLQVLVWARPMVLHGRILTELTTKPFFGVPAPEVPVMGVVATLALLAVYATALLVVTGTRFLRMDLPDRPTVSG